MKPILIFSALLSPTLCFGNEAKSAAAAWENAFFSDRFELRDDPPSEPGLTLRWSSDGLTPRPGAQPWAGPLWFAETTRFRFQVFQGQEKSGEAGARNLVRLADAPPVEGAEAGLWTRLPGSPWSTLAPGAPLPAGSRSQGVLKITQPGRFRLDWSEAFLRVSLGGFIFDKAAQAEAPFWIEAGSFPLVVETLSSAKPASLRIEALDTPSAPAEIRRASSSPVPLLSAPALPAVSDGFLSSAWTFPVSASEQSFALSFSRPVEGALVFFTDPSLRRFPALLRLPDGAVLTLSPVGPGRFHVALPGPVEALALVQPVGGEAWSLSEIEHLEADRRPFTCFAVNCLPGDDSTALPALRPLADLVSALWPRLAVAARHDPRGFPRQLWVASMPGQGDPVKVIGRHFLIAREFLDKPETRGILAQKLGELAARPVGSSPFDVSQGLGAGVVLAALGPGGELPGGGTFILPEASRAQRVAKAAREHPEAFLKLLQAARSGWDVSVWKQFEARVLNEKTTGN